MNDDVPWSVAIILLHCEVDRNGCWVYQRAKDKDGYGKTKGAVHRQVLSSLVPPPTSKSMACHHCDVPACCNPAHLYWGTAETNVRDMMRRGRRRGGFVSGEQHPQAKLTDSQVLEIRRTPKTWGSGKSLSEKYGISQGRVCEIRSSKRYKRVGH